MREGDLSKASDDAFASLLVSDTTKDAEEVDKHHTKSKFRTVIETIDLATVLRDSSERHDVVKIHVQFTIDVIDESFNILSRGLIEGNNSQSRSMTTKRLEESLIVFNSLAVVTGGSDNDMSTTREKSLDDLSSDRAPTDTGAQSILTFKSHPRCSKFMENVKVDISEVATKLPRGSNLTL